MHRKAPLQCHATGLEQPDTVSWRSRDQESLLDAELQAPLARETTQKSLRSKNELHRALAGRRISRSTPATDAICRGGMVQVTLDEAVARLDELMGAARGGEAVVIMHGGAAVQLVPVPTPAATHGKRRKAGGAAGQIWMAPDFNAPLDDVEEYER
ncbi:type II toxin-antitoxin system Phd/YefM family antitoxin [Sorangium sp. So ce1151]|uniref:type II toxin-antitoxin system Phd/YefM family antitoxin n=1 Tax=Sorangium sp. So ce1151 TaxID=3133332 RepID=UPI003F60B5F1